MGTFSARRRRRRAGAGRDGGGSVEQAAHALTAVITHAEVEPQRSVEVRCEAPDIELSIEALLRVSKIRFFNICDEGRQG